MTSGQIILLATPVFWLLMALEWAVGRRRGRDNYRLADAFSSIGLGMINQVVGVFTKALSFGLYVWAYQHLALWHLDAKAWWVWPLALVAYDFLYYWYHRCGHRVAVMWAAHAVHHQSEDYNLSTALRQTGTGWLLGWVFYLPMALCGVPPLVMGVVALVDLLCQYWVHTEHIGKLGWFDRWFCSPSNHRAHHAVNDRYVDKNYGGIFILWDRLFGTFVEEDDAEPCVYGTRSPLRSWNPLRANAQVYLSLWQSSQAAEGWRHKMEVWLRPPGWQANGPPKAHFDAHHLERYEPAVPRTQAWAATALFLLALNLTALFLWSGHRQSLMQQVAVASAIVAALCAVAWLTDGPRRSASLNRATP